MPVISTAAIDRLIEIGQAEDFERLAALPDEFPELRDGQFMRTGWPPWYELAESLTDQKLMALIKTLTVAEQKLPDWTGGSVTPAIWLFQSLRRRLNNDPSEFVEWLLAHTTNPYIPYGHGVAHNEEEFRHLKVWGGFRSKTQVAERKRQAEAKTRKAKQATHNLFGAVRRGDIKAIAALLDRGADPGARDEQGQTPKEYAVSLGNEQVIAALDGRGAQEDMP